MKDYVSNIYKDREGFIVIGLTGKHGSGCSTVANILENGYQDYNELNCIDKPVQNRKDGIIKKFASVSFKEKKFEIIKPSTLIMMLFIFEKKIFFAKIEEFKILLDKGDNKTLLSEKIESLKKLYLVHKEFDVFKESDIFEKLFNKENDYTNPEIRKELSNYIKEQKSEYEQKVLNEDMISLKKEINILFRCDLIDEDFNQISLINEYKASKNNFKEKFKLKRRIIDQVLDFLAKNKSNSFIKLYKYYNKEITNKRNKKILTVKQLQTIGDLVREQIAIFELPNYINLLIKSFRKEFKKNKIIGNKENSSCYIVIDSLKNPFEILYFKERYSAYYTFSVHAKDEIIYDRFIDKEEINIKEIHKKELNLDNKGKQKGSLDSKKDFISQNVIECIQRSDIYIDNNHDKKDTLYKQIFRYLSLIVHPGLITPSKDEMIMQLALNAKFNSGCISRQVGAVVLNKFESVKAIGWNDVPEGQMPCLLRSHNELLENTSSIDYSKYERNTIRKEDFFKYIFSKEKSNHPDNEFKESNEKGLNDSFCFKSIKNKIDDNKNQVYTRSLHAEENAFLQASKYGNSEIIGGQLFTTASPCFLCAKKAYQLGMKRIVYIEAYPDISNEQVFDIGTNEIEMVHFRGAIGLAYQKLYEPIFSYKDELNALNATQD